MKKVWRTLILTLAVLMFGQGGSAVAQALNMVVQGPSGSPVYAVGSFTFPAVPGASGDFTLADVIGIRANEVQITTTTPPTPGFPLGSNALLDVTNIGYLGTSTTPIYAANCAATPCVGHWAAANVPGTFGFNSVALGFTLNGSYYGIYADCGGGGNTVTCASVDIYKFASAPTCSGSPPVCFYGGTLSSGVITGTGITRLQNNQKLACQDKNGIQGTGGEGCVQGPPSVPEIDAATLPKAVLLIGSLLLLRRRRKETV